jgi:hypothetical protein
MKRARPSRHYRIVKTKKGRKKILVNKDVTRKRAKNHGVINPRERKVFKHMSNPNEYTNEFGGAIDFDRSGQIENINVVPGQTYDVDLPPDYEVQYHTHPDRGESPPTPEDIQALLGNTKQQAELIFRNGEGFLVLKTRKTRALSKLPATQLQKKLDKAFFSSRQEENWEQAYKKQLEELGFIVFINKDMKKPFTIGIKPREPKRRKK